MKIFADEKIKKLFIEISTVMTVFLFLSQLIVWLRYKEFSLFLLLLAIMTMCGILSGCLRYFHGQYSALETAVSQVDAYLSGDKDARIECDEEGEIYIFFHSVNTLATVLNAHVEKELHAKEALRDIISDISHQLKTPLAALNIYNGLIQSETEASPIIMEFAELSEQELDRIETLVQNLLKIARLDAGSIVIEKDYENVSEMMKDIELHFEYRAKREGKKINLSGENGIMLFCDRDWITEAIGNIVKNAFDHTSKGCVISLEWKRAADMTEIKITDNGSGIHNEDIPHIFKRFYRSRFSQDTQGTGLGLPLAKAIIEAHSGNIFVDSVLGHGSTFIVSFLNSGRQIKQGLTH